MSLRVWFLLVLPLALSAADDLSPLSDEFRSDRTRSRWLRIHHTEGWGNDALATLDFGGKRPGRLLMAPHTSVWYEEWRGELTYQNVTGDFVITTEVGISRRGGGGAPRSPYSLAGLMVRAPRSMSSPDQWTPGGQNYVFLSLGSANVPGTYQHEVKTTVASRSTLEISSGTPRAWIQVARIGHHLILLRRAEGGDWVVHRRYARPDFPATLQAGLTAYTDWPGCERVGFSAQNITVLTNGARLPDGGTFAGADPDLEAEFEYVRYLRPRVPADLAGADLSNPAQISDAQLLAFLGDEAHEPAEPLLLLPEASPMQPLRLRFAYASGDPIEAHRFSYLGVWANTSLPAPLSDWHPLPGFVQTDSISAFLDDLSAQDSAYRFYRALELP